jgi:hypothetical protein
MNADERRLRQIENKEVIGVYRRLSAALNGFFNTPIDQLLVVVDVCDQEKPLHTSKVLEVQWRR